jgi:hypothetical protein
MAFGPKTRNRAFIARFRACCIKQRCGVMLGGGGVARIRQWWWWGGAFANCEAEESLGQKPETERLWLGFRRAV